MVKNEPYGFVMSKGGSRRTGTFVACPILIRPYVMDTHHAALTTPVSVVIFARDLGIRKVFEGGDLFNAYAVSEDRPQYGFF